MAAETRLVMRTGPAVGKVYPLEKLEISIGRDLANDISINDPEVSRRHARIFLQGDRYILEDLGSTNGTMIGGQRLSGPYALRPGDLIILGEQVSLSYEEALPEPEMTVAAQAPQAQQSQPVYQQVQTLRPEAPLPAASAAQEAYAGQAAYHEEFYDDEEPEKKKFPVWAIVIIVLVLALICICVGGLIFIDVNSLWCQALGFILNVLMPGVCP
jgi:pSer/pThr/pTyr-binding forkhead associated (FHA) protein